MVKRSNNRSLLAPLLLSLSAATSTLAQYSSSNTACTSHYVVQDGDTCDIIGQKTMTSTAQIMSLNLPYAGPSCYELETGVQICLGTYGNDCQLVYRAKESDTCGSISKQFNITTATLLTNNAMLECGQVYAGLMLCVVEGIIRPPAPMALNITFDALSPGYTNANSTMPLGTPIVAVNAGLLPPAPVQPASVVAASISTSSTIASSAATSSTAAASSSAASINAAASTGTSSKHSSKHSSKAAADHKHAKSTSSTSATSTTGTTSSAASTDSAGSTSSTSHHAHHTTEAHHKSHGHHAHHAGHEGHKPKGHSHHAAAKRWQESHSS